MIGKVADHNLVVSLVNSHTPRVGKLPISISIRPEFEQELACLVKYLHSMVDKFNDHDITP